MYPFAVYNTLIPGAILLRRLAPHKFLRTWAPPFRAFGIAVALYFLGNVFLLLAPLLPPERGFHIYEHLPY